MMNGYSYFLQFSSDGGWWHIAKVSEEGSSSHLFDKSSWVFSHPHNKADDNEGVPPAVVRQKFEELCGRPEFVDYDDPPAMPNLVELIADEDDCAWDQPYAFGYRVETHAVYCHNEKWLYSPRKCHRNRDDWPHEKCRGFKPNPLLSPSRPIQKDAAK